MIFSSKYLMELREIGISSHNLKQMVLTLAARCRQLEKELTNGDKTESNQARSGSAIGESGSRSE
jgi:hypothetical protein